MTRTALILGATGGIGGEVAATLGKRGWHIKALHRDPARLDAGADKPASVTWIAGDALIPADVARAAQGASLIVHAVNPPGYRNWGKLVLPMLDSTIAAAKSSGARILLPGTVYNYGPDAFPILSEESPQNPRTRKGAIRAEMERRLGAAADLGVRSLIVRAGDFFGPRAANNWFSQGLVKPGKPVTAISYPGRRGTGHAWAYLPDLAETMVQLVERESQLATFETFHFAGHWDADGSRMLEAIRAAAGNSRIKVHAFPWPAVIALAPFVTLFREMLEMRYLWREPLQLNNQRLISVLGREPHTPLEEAVRTALVGLGCLAPKETLARVAAQSRV